LLTHLFGHQNEEQSSMMNAKQKLKTFVKRDLLDVLLLLLCAFVGWYAYDRSNICANASKENIKDILVMQKMDAKDGNFALGISHAEFDTKTNDQNKPPI
jgi:hypothetical protein